MSKKTTKLGIDLGTTNSCCYCIRPNGNFEVVHTTEGLDLLLSAPMYKNGQDPIFGKNCSAAIKHGKRNIARYFKRLIGRKFDDPVVQNVLKYCGAPVIDRGDGYPCYNLDAVEVGMRKTPVEVATDILNYIIERARVFNETEIENICITIPAGFDKNQRTATINALKNCGFSEDRIKVISEPCAAAITYITENPGHKEHILIFDFGGGTFDVSIVHVSNGEMCVEAYRGDNTVGGINIDMKLADWIKEKYFNETGNRIPDIRGKKNIASKLLSLAEGAKIVLSSEQCVDISLESIADNGDDDDEEEEDDNEISITRAEFERLIEDILIRILEVVDECIQAAGLEKADIGDVVFVGGSTRIPCIRKAIQNHFTDTVQLRDSVNPDECVANGALLYFNTNIFIRDRTPYSFGHLVNGTRCECIIPMDSALPITETVENKITTSTCYLSLRLFQGHATHKEQLERIRDCIYLGDYNTDLEVFMDKYELEEDDMAGRTIETTYSIQQFGKIIITVRDKETGYILVDNRVIEYQFH